MIPGLNTNVTHAGVEYHVQTEDLGRKNPYVLTLVFQAGAILAQEKINYREALGEGASEAQIKRFMHQQHQRIIQSIRSGQSRRPAASEPATKPPPPGPPSAPRPSLPSADKSLDRLVREYLRTRKSVKPR